MKWTRNHPARPAAPGLRSARNGEPVEILSPPTVLMPPRVSAPAGDTTAVEPCKPASLGPYTLQRQIGQGGMGAVYYAIDENLQRPTAVKVVTRRLAADPVAREFLKREAQAAARLTHPNIVGVYAWGEEGDEAYIAFEYVEGMDLRQLIGKTGRIPLARALDIVRQAAAGLRFASARQIIHRDIKPANLMITNDGRVKIADFGLAKMLDADAGIAQPGVVVGSPAYMSPEQGQGEAVDFRADIYSLGCTLYACLSGRPPFAAQTPAETVARHASEVLPEFPEARTMLDGAVWDLLTRMMAKRPEDRHASYGELMDELDALAAMAARPIPSRRRFPSAQAAVACGGAIVALIASFAWEAIANRTAPEAADAPGPAAIQLPLAGLESMPHVVDEINARLSKLLPVDSMPSNPAELLANGQIERFRSAIHTAIDGALDSEQWTVTGFQ